MKYWTVSILFDLLSSQKVGPPLGCAHFVKKIFSLRSEMKWNWSHFACVSLVHFKNSVLFFRFSILFASNFSLCFNKAIFALERNEGKTFFSLQNKQKRSLLLRIFRFLFKKTLFSHYFASKLSFRIKKSPFFTSTEKNTHFHFESFVYTWER